MTSPLGHMFLDNLGTAPGIMNLVVLIGALQLVFDKGLGVMHFANVVVQRSRSHQLHITPQGPSPCFR